MADTNTDIKKMPFERAIEELESIVQRLEGGKVPLEESVAIYERGEALKRRCEELLRQAEARVEKITLGAGGKPTGTEPAKRPVDRQPPVITKEEVEAAERGEGHAHRDVESSTQEKARRQKHHGVGDAGLNADDTAEKTEVDGHGGLGSGGGPRDT